MELHQHRDGMVFLRDHSGCAHCYGEHNDKFVLDSGRALPPLPAGMVEMRYDSETKILVYFDAKGNAFPVEGQASFPFGDVICAARRDLIAAKETRITAEKAAALTSAPAPRPTGAQGAPSVLA